MGRVAPAGDDKGARTHAAVKQLRTTHQNIHPCKASERNTHLQFPRPGGDSCKRPKRMLPAALTAACNNNCKAWQAGRCNMRTTCNALRDCILLDCTLLGCWDSRMFELVIGNDPA
jgi:hypothetical protein